MSWSYWSQILYDVGYNAAPVVAGFFAYMWGKTAGLRSRRHGQPSVEEAAYRDFKVYQILGEMRATLGAMSTHLTPYHDGDQFIDGGEFYKMSRTHEVNDPLQPSYKAFHKGIFLSARTEEVRLVLEKGPGYRLVKDLPDTEFRTQCMLEELGAIARCAIRRNGSVVGFIGADFKGENKPEQIGEMEQFAQRIEGILYRK